MAKLTAWNDLAEEIGGLPHEFSLAIMSGRGELAGLIRRPLSLEETRSVAHAIRVLIETNRRLQRHSAQVAERAANVRGTCKGLLNQLEGLEHQAEFRDEQAETDDET
jgi:hypothetical protein